MIDLHSHILPGLDDGAPDVAASLALGRVAAADGVDVIAATPHIRDDYAIDVRELAGRCDELNSQLREAGITLEVIAAGEVSFSKAVDLDDDALERLCLGGRYLLVESPYTAATDLLENAIFELQRRGFMPVLAHPERSPSLASDRDRLSELVARGVHCSVTATSLTGGFGSTVRRHVLEMFEAGLVHNIASDAHNDRNRPPRLSAALETLGTTFPDIGSDASWFVDDAPRAILRGEHRIGQPPVPRERGLVRLARRLRRRSD